MTYDINDMSITKKKCLNFTSGIKQGIQKWHLTFATRQQYQWEKSSKLKHPKFAKVYSIQDANFFEIMKINL